MPKFKGFKFTFNLSSKNELQLDLSENNVSPVYVTGAYKVIGEQFYGTGSYDESPKKVLTPSMVKLPPPFQPDPTDPDVIKASKSSGDLTLKLQPNNLPPNLRKSTPELSTDPRGATSNKRESTDVRRASITDNKNNEKDLKKLDKKRLAEQKKQEKLEAQQRAKEEKLRKEKEKAELKEKAKQEKIRLKKEKADAAKAKKEDKAAPKGRTNPLAQGPNAPLPYETNTLQSSTSKTSGPPPYEASNPNAVGVRNMNKEVVQNENDDTGNTSFSAPIESGSAWDLVAQHRAQVSRAPLGGASSKVAIRLHEPADPNAGVTGRKSLYV